MSRRTSRHSAARAPKMPVGLIQLMEELSRDVLRNNPTDLYSFCADHMKKLLVIRESSKSKERLTLEEKMELARAKVRERASLRCEKYDKKIQEMINKNDLSITKTQEFQEHICVKDSIENVAVNAGQEEKQSTTMENISELTGNSQLQEKNDDKTLQNNTNDNFSSKASLQGVTDKVQIRDEKENIEYSLKSVEEPVTSSNNKTDTNVTKIEQVNKPTSSQELMANVDHTVDLSEDLLSHDRNDIVKRELSNTEIGETQNDHSSFDLPENSKVEIEQRQSEIQLEINNRYSHDFNNMESEPATTNESEKEKQMDQNEGLDNLENELQKLPEVEENAKKDIETVNSSVDQEVMNAKKNDSTEKLHDNGNTFMDLETAAITIQKVFRSFLFRNKTQSIDDATNVDINLLVEEKEKKADFDQLNINLNKDRRTLGLNRIDNLLQTVNEEKSLSLSTDDSSTLSSAATVIQAHVRGFLVRNKINNVNKTNSSTSGIDSDGQSFTSFEGENDNRKNKTILNIHIVPENGHFMSRDESMLTSIDLSLDGSPPNSSNLHPLGYDKTERRKQLKREDAVQSISPPSNNSGKQSEDVESVKELLMNNENNGQRDDKADLISSTVENNSPQINRLNDENSPSVLERHDVIDQQSSTIKRSSSEGGMDSQTDEMDVVTPTTPLEEKSPGTVNDTQFLHTGECHDLVLPTKVTRKNTAVVRGE